MGEQKPDQKNGNGRDRRAKIEALKERKAEKATRPDTFVVYSRVPETVRVLQVFERGGDYGITKLRKGLAIRYEAGKALPLLEEVAQATRQLSEAVAKVCKLVDVEYNPPPGLGKNGGPEKKTKE
ncbi:MAG: hypothetical protein HZA04_02950 [Nitrospinae bacterium]|nr:hypothetical protein [Nitrospinota bacterium]